MTTSREKLDAFLADARHVVVCGVRKNGVPHLSPNYFEWDGEKFYVSTLRSRVKYKIFQRDPRAQLLFDDPTALRAVLVHATVEIREDLVAELHHFRTIRTKYGMYCSDDDDEFRRDQEEQGRVLLVLTPDAPIEEWTSWGFD
jgi:PPOX class probable F420-dependent enzyme